MNPKKSVERKEPGLNVLDAIGWHGGPEYLDRDVYALWVLYISDPTTNFPAFEVLERIARHYWDDDVPVERPDANFGMHPLTPVEVPWWVVHLLGRSNHNYRTTKGLSAGKAFLLEGGTKGKKRRITLFETRRRRVDLALKVAYVRAKAELDGQPLAVERAVQDISERHGVSSDTVWTAWKQFGQKASDALRRQLRRSGKR